MNDPQPDSNIDLQETYEPSPRRPPGQKGLLRRFVMPIGLLVIFLLSKLKYLVVLLQVGKFKTFITMLRVIFESGV